MSFGGSLFLNYFSCVSFAAQSIVNTFALSDHRGSLPRNQGQRYSYHENPAHRYEHDFSSLPRDHRFLSWKRDLRPGGPQAQSGRRAPGASATASEIEGHRRSFHYDDRKEFAPQYAVRGGSMKREMSPARRSFDPSIYETCDRYALEF